MRMSAGPAARRRGERALVSARRSRTSSGGTGSNRSSRGAAAPAPSPTQPPRGGGGFHSACPGGMVRRLLRRRVLLRGVRLPLVGRRLLGLLGGGLQLARGGEDEDLDPAVLLHVRGVVVVRGAGLPVAHAD